MGARGKKAAITSEEIRSSFKGMNEALTAQRTGKGAIEDLGLLAQLVELDQKKIYDTAYTMTKLQEALSKPAPKGLLVTPTQLTEMARSFGVADRVIVGLKKGIFNEEAFKGAVIYTSKQIKNLKNMSNEWSKMGESLNKSFGKFVNVWGPEMLNILREMTKLLTFIVNKSTAFSKIMKENRVVGSGIIHSKGMRVPAPGGGGGGNTSTVNQTVNIIGTNIKERDASKGAQDAALNALRLNQLRNGVGTRGN